MGAGLVQHVILHLSDSMPVKALERMRREVARLPGEESKRELAEKIEAWSDAGHGCCALRQAAHAGKLRDTLLHFHEIRYRLFAWVIMPNHVHVLFETFPEWTLDGVVNGWKKCSATEILMDHQPLPRPLWQREFWDRYTRNLRHFRKTVDYIHQNPVKAGLVSRAEDWPWSTAGAWAPFLG
jgi:REP element-mobilizing transposase RayT